MPDQRPITITGEREGWLETIGAEAAIRATLERHGRPAHRGQPCRIARDLLIAGFDAGEVDGLLRNLGGRRR